MSEGEGKDGMGVDNYNYDGEEQNPLEGTTKINEDSNNTTALNLMNNLNSNTLYSGKFSKHEQQPSFLD